MLLGSILFCGMVVFRLEGDSRLKHNDFTELTGHHRTWPIRSALTQSIFLVSMAVAGNPRLVPTTIPSRLFIFVKSFSMYIIMASYLANFAAKLATPPTAVQLVSGFDAFATLGAPMCIRNSATYVAFASVVYPQIQTILAGPDTVDVLNGVQNGTCIGGMVNEIELRYAFGAGDPNASYCGVSYQGAPSVATFQFAIPFTSNSAQLPDSAFAAINQALDLYLYSGNYTTQTARTYLPQRPPQKCAKYYAQFLSGELNGAFPPLNLEDLGGVFIFMGATALLCLLMQAGKRWNRAIVHSVRLRNVLAPLSRRLSRGGRRPGAAAAQMRWGMDGGEGPGGGEEAAGEGEEMGLAPAEGAAGAPGDQKRGGGAPGEKVVSFVSDVGEESVARGGLAHEEAAQLRAEVLQLHRERKVLIRAIEQTLIKH